MMLADYGAKVIKIEIPGKGDDTRSMGPIKNGASMYYANVNRGKKGITLNLKPEEGKTIFKEMVKKPMSSLKITVPASWINWVSAMMY